MLRLLPAQGKLVLQQLTKLPCTAWLPRNFIQSEISILTTGNNLICCETGLSYGKTGSKSVQIVSQHCWGTWLKAMLHVLPPTFKPALPQIRLLESVNTDFSLDKITLESHQTRTDVVAKSITTLYFLSPLFENCNNLICCKRSLNVGGKKRNTDFQIFLQRCCKKSFTFLLPVLP